MKKALTILAAAVDVLLLIDIATDLIAKRKARKAQKENDSTTEEEEPVPATVES